VILHLAIFPALAVDSAVWAVWSLAVSWWVARLPASRLRADGWLTRLRPWEESGRVYRSIGIRRWKPWLPDLGALFGSGHKKVGARRDPTVWQAVAVESRRSERAHWVMLAALPALVLVRGGVILVPMAAYAVTANLPCIAAQRYNRGRLLRLTLTPVR
jgi:glycosyl-4,4'-diaponeurosporenoate acyltransferase